jgi:hypothetical protein
MGCGDGGLMPIGRTELGEAMGDVIGGSFGRDEEPPGAPAHAVLLGTVPIGSVFIIAS